PLMRKCDVNDCRRTVNRLRPKKKLQLGWHAKRRVRPQGQNSPQAPLEALSNPVTIRSGIRHFLCRDVSSFPRQFLQALSSASRTVAPELTRFRLSLPPATHLFDGPNPPWDSASTMPGNSR